MDDGSLLAAWDATLPGRPDLGLDLVSRYAEPSRHYHDRTHLSDVLAAVDLLADEAVHPLAVRLAAWFHDAVYDVRGVDNEERSAVLAQTRLSAAGVPADVVTEVARLVRLTVAHAPDDGDADGAVLCDADLAILAADPGRYAAYVSAVRAEYAHVGDDDFRRGRAQVLRQLVGLPHLYATTPGRRDWEIRARANLARELTHLGC